MKLLVRTCLLLFFLGIILIFPTPIIEAVKLGFMTWAEKVVPALFPFFVLTRLMIHYQVPQLIGKLCSPFFNRILHLSPITCFIMLMSLISGNPSGPKLARDYYDQELLSEKECEGLFYFCTFASPLFILGTIGVVLFHSTTLGYLMLAAHLLGAIVVFISCYSYLKTTSNQTVSIVFPRTTFAEILIDSIENSIQTLLRVGGIITFYYIITAILSTLHITAFLDHTVLPLLHNSLPTLEPLLAGFFEFVQGVTKLSMLSMSLPLQLALIAFCVSFAGLSVHTQVFMFATNLKISYTKYFGFRVLHGLSSATFIYFVSPYFLTPSSETLPTGTFVFFDKNLILLSMTLIFTYFILRLKKAYARA